jgi:hypothetical protein
LRIFDRNGVALKAVGARLADGPPPVQQAADLLHGENRLTLESQSSGTARLTVITLGDRADP